MLLQNALFLFIPDIYIRGWTLIKVNDSGRKMKVDGSGRPISFMVYLRA